MDLISNSPKLVKASVTQLRARWPADLRRQRAPGQGLGLRTRVEVAQELRAGHRAHRTQEPRLRRQRLRYLISGLEKD